MEEYVENNKRSCRFLHCMHQTSQKVMCIPKSICNLNKNILKEKAYIYLNYYLPNLVTIMQWL
jgi:hypothetical protein